MKHFLNLNEIGSNDLIHIVEQAINIKNGQDKSSKGALDSNKPLDGKVVAMIFDKPSTRTRVSFDVGIKQLGGQTIVLSGSDLQLGHGESIADTAKVLSRYVDLIIIRTFDESTLYELAQNSNVPVINGLTNATHPCQSMADVMTFQEHRGSIKRKQILWLGDGNNVCASTLQAAGQFNFDFTFCGPETLDPNHSYLDYARRKGSNVTIVRDPIKAISNADLIMTDTWVSMHEKNNQSSKTLDNQLKPYQVNSELMKQSKKEALFMHCLPAHRGQEVTSDVLDGVQSKAFDQAENRLHVQKAILRWCLDVL